MEKQINPIVAFKFIIQNESYHKFLQKGTFSMLSSFIAGQTNSEHGVSNKLEELRELFSRFKNDYNRYPTIYSTELMEIYRTCNFKELTEQHLQDYFSIEIDTYDQDLLVPLVNKWLETVWMIYCSRQAFEKAKESPSIDERLSIFKQNLEQALSFEVAEDTRLVCSIDDLSTYLGQKEEQRVLTGFRGLDEMLSATGKAEDGGFYKGGLFCFMAPPKGLKTLVLTNLIGQARKKGLNVAVASYEVGKLQYMERINCAVHSIPRSLYDNGDCMKEVHERDKEKISKYGGVYFRQFTNAHSPKDVELWVKKVETQNNCKIDMVFVDYINLMASGRGNKAENTYLTVKHNAEDLRSAAIKNNWVMVTATQTNRQAVGAETFNLSDVSESFGLPATVDALFGIAPQFNIPDQRKIELIASRVSGSPKPIYMHVDWSIWKLREIADWNDAGKDAVAQIKNPSQLI